MFLCLCWDTKTGTVVFASIVVISPLQSIVQDQAAGIPSTGMSASDFKEKLRTIYKKYIKESISYATAKAAIDKRLMNFIIEIPIIQSACLVDESLDGTWVSGKPVCSVCSEFKITSFALCRYNKIHKIFFPLGLMSASCR